MLHDLPSHLCGSLRHLHGHTRGHTTRRAHAVRVGMVVSFYKHGHVGTTKTLSCRDRTISVGDQQRFEINDLFSKLSYRLGEGIIFGAKEFNLGLEVSQPLLLALTTLEGSNSVNC